MTQAVSAIRVVLSQVHLDEKTATRADLDALRTVLRCGVCKISMNFRSVVRRGLHVCSCSAHLLIQIDHCRRHESIVFDLVPADKAGELGEPCMDEFVNRAGQLRREAASSAKFRCRHCPPEKDKKFDLNGLQSHLKMKYVACLCRSWIGTRTDALFKAQDS